MAAAVRDAHETGRPCRIVGAGGWLDAGRPVAGDPMRIDVRRALHGITEYVPGDLTLTALAGTSLGDLHEATRAYGQRLALDPYGSDEGTLGATIATASAGPSASAYGTPRDQVLGLAFVTGTGETVRAGGRVVKNVAGFDLVRLCTGAWGTLGVITEASVRLRALPVADETCQVALDTVDDSRVRSAIDGLRALALPFEAVELLDAATAGAIGLPDAPHGALLVRMTGSADVVRAMRASLATIGAASEVDPASWRRLRANAPTGSACVRFSSAHSGAGDTWATARRVAASAGGSAHLAVGRSVARVTMARAAEETDEAFANRVTVAIGRLDDFTGTVVAERLPASAWHCPVLTRRRGDAAVHARLVRGVRDAFDPGRVLNRGILGAAGGEP
ncbi:MAG: FAD-binding protein [Gemmatimonadaceae bacterium]|nr:FAD-binding protein [Gemmatimonadaceae bacterium]